jgi:predicted deacetylase
MKSLVVSLHDVSPLTQSLCEKILSDLDELGVNRTSLLIIPNHHGRAPITQNSSFQRWLTRQIGAGHEPVLHGYFHRRQKNKADPWFWKLTTEIYTAGEGEFFDLSFDRAARSLCDGLAELAFLPRKVIGFVAPAWLLSEAAEQAVRSLGFVYTTRIGCVRIFKPLDEVKSRSLVWSTRAPWRVVASLYWNKVLAISKSGAPVLRVSIHPADIQHKPVWRQIRKIIATAVRERDSIPYERLVEAWKSNPAEAR